MLPYGAITRVVREDDQRRDLLFAGTETGIYISMNGGMNWMPFNLNLPVTPITDLRVHQGDMIAATSGRSFWILDDLGLIRQYQPIDNAMTLYQPEDTYLVNGSSDLDHTSSEFKGSQKSRGVNHATGIVLYYNLPELEASEVLTLEVADASG